MKIKSFVFALFFLSVTSAFGIYGPGSVVVNCTYTYTHIGSVVFPEWQVTASGSIISTTIQGGTYQATIRWNNASPGVVTFKDGTTIKGSMVVTVYSSPLPPNVISNARCGTGTLYLQASQGATGGNVRWYTSASGGAYFLEGGSYTTPAISTTTVYYVTTRDLCSGLESSPRTPVSAVIMEAPSAPLSSTGGRGFKDSEVTLTVSEVSGALSYRWYATSGPGTPVATTGVPSLTRTLSAPITLYVSGVSSACEGVRTSVEATIEPDPVITATANRLVMGEEVTLATSEAYQTYTWRDQSGNIVGSASTLVVSVPGVYTVEVTKTDVQGSGLSLPFVIRDQMDDETQNLNYIVTNAPTQEVTVEASVESLTVNQRSQTIRYFDDLGRPVQTVITQGSPSKKDIVQPFAYDEFGRQEISYLPYTIGSNGWYKPNALLLTTHVDKYEQYKTGEHYQFYTTASNVATDPKPFSVTQFEANPLSRVSKQGAPGADWQPKTDPATDRSVKYEHSFNSAEEVLMFIYDPSTELVNAGSDGVPRYYEANTLYAERTFDENNNEVIEFIDREGFTVCRKVQYAINDDGTGKILYATTYYVYDDQDNLVTVLPPEATNSSLEAFIK